MTTYYIIVSDGTYGHLDSTTTVQPTNPAVIYTTTAPEDNSMLYNLTTLVWFWTKDLLKGLANSTRQANMQADITINAVAYPYLNIPLGDWALVADVARGEDPTATRNLIINTYPVPTVVNLTNATLVALVNDLIEAQQKQNDVLATIFTQIDSNTITTKALLDGAWTSLGSAYTTPVKLPSRGAFEGTTFRAGAFQVNKSGTVASGVIALHLTADGTSTGTALFPHGPIKSSLNAFVSDATASYQMGVAWSNSDKTVTVTANKLTTSNILTGILGQAAANGSVVNLQVQGY